MGRKKRLFLAERWGMENAPDLMLDIHAARRDHRGLVERRADLDQKANQCTEDLFPEDAAEIAALTAMANKSLRSVAMRLDMAERKLIKAHEENT